MVHSQQVDRVRKLVSARFRAFNDGQDIDFCETILVRDGCYCGRRFAASEWRAVWLIEEQIVKFFADNDHHLESVAVRFDNDHMAEAA
jgi:hypothetical protein